MDDMEEKLSSILGNPQMMQQIMAMAQTLGQSQPPPKEEPRPEPPRQLQSATGSMPDAAMLQRVFNLARQSGIDKNQQSLLKALGPYLSRERISKLEKAMRAARIAAMASTALRSAGISTYSGR